MWWCGAGGVVVRVSVLFGCCWATRAVQRVENKQKKKIYYLFWRTIGRVLCVFSFFRLFPNSAPSANFSSTTTDVGNCLHSSIVPYLCCDLRHFYSVVCWVCVNFKLKSETTTWWTNKKTKNLSLENLSSFSGFSRIFVELTINFIQTR